MGDMALYYVIGPESLMTSRQSLGAGTRGVAVIMFVEQMR